MECLFFSILNRITLPFTAADFCNGYGPLMTFPVHEVRHGHRKNHQANPRRASVGAVSGFLWNVELKGFGLKITAGGSASYVVQYRMGGREAKTPRYAIGSRGSPWTPFTAREEATRLLRLVAQGIDPVETAKQRRREAAELAFSNYADRFAADCKGKGWSTLVTRSLHLHVKPVLRDKALPTITRI